MASCRTDCEWVVGLDEDGRIAAASALPDVPGARAFTVQHLLELSWESVQWLQATVREHLIEQGRTVHRMDEMSLGAPLPDLDKIVCPGQSHSEPMEEMVSEWPEWPSLLSWFRNALEGGGDATQLPRVSQQVDYEAEPAVVTNRPCRHVREENALPRIGGHVPPTIGNARAVPVRTGTDTVGKQVTDFCRVGPRPTLTEGVSEPQVLAPATHLNGDQERAGTTFDTVLGEGGSRFPGSLTASDTAERARWSRSPAAAEALGASHHRPPGCVAGAHRG
ncbi:MAG: fumarylacetoacetate hydrolase family protein [Candidatus Dormibacteria bacterium]